MVSRLNRIGKVKYETFENTNSDWCSWLCSMILIALGMVGLYEFTKTSAPVLSEIVLIGGIGSAVLGGGFHILCTIEPWLF